MVDITRKSFLNGLLVGAGVVALSSNNASAETDSDDLALSERYFNGLFSLLDAAETCKDDLGFGDVDFFDTVVGVPIPVYECRATGYVQTGIVTPLSFAGTIVATTSAVQGINAPTQLSFKLASHLAEAVSEYSATELAVVYDARGLGIFDGTTLHLVEEYASEMMETAHDSLVPATNCSVEGTSVMDACTGLSISSVVMSTSSSGGDDTDLGGTYGTPSHYPTNYHYLPSTPLSVSNNAQSWAACVAYVYNFKNPNSHSTVAGTVTYNMEAGFSYYLPSPFLVPYFLWHNLNLGQYVYFPEHPAIQTVYNQIVQENPLISICCNLQGNIINHYVVIMGASQQSDVLGVMDPEGGDFYFVIPYAGYAYQNVIDNQWYQLCDNIRVYPW